MNRVQLAGLQGESALRSHIVSASFKGVERVAVNGVRCFIAEQKYVRVLHPGGSLLIADTLKDLEQEFSYQFLRAHRNSLVARSYIVGLRRDTAEGWLVELDGVAEKPSVSRRHLSDLKEQLS